MVSYFGLVDDFAARHEDGAITSMSDLNKQLIFAVLFDEPLLINDGHIINSPVVYDAVLNRDDASPLRKLVQSSYIQILTRNQSSLHTLAERMADYGITRAQERLREPDYDALRHVLNKWSGTLTENSFRLWPRKDTSAVFEKLAVGALDKAVDRVHDKAHKTQLTQFKTQFTGRDRRNRTTWEEIAVGMRSSGVLSYDIQRSILHMANEAYQYSWGCTLSTPGVPAKVHTRSPEFLNIDQSITPSGSPTRQPVTVYVPNLDLAAKRVGNEWDKLAAVGRAEHDLYWEKHRFLATLEAYYTSTRITDKEMQEQAKAYSDALTLHFGGERTSIMFDLSLLGLSTAAGTPAAPLGNILGAGVGLLGIVASHAGGAKFVRRAVLPITKKWIGPQKRAESTSCFQVDPDKAAEIMEGIPDFTPPD